MTLVDLKPIESAFQRAREVVLERFPHLWLPTLACLSNIAALSYEVSYCQSVFLIGPPASGKTTVLDFFTTSKAALRVDGFTRASFVSHYASKTDDELRESDLLPQLRDRVLLTPDLVSLLTGEESYLRDTFSMLTRVLDGEGYQTASGIHGLRGYAGKYAFVWLGATPRVSTAAWSIMAQAGSRLFFLQMPTPTTAVDMFSANPYERMKAECRDAISGLVDELRAHVSPRSLQWNLSEVAELHREVLNGFGDVVAHGRGYIDDDGTAIPEHPQRAVQGFAAMSYGHALLNGRLELRNEDLIVPLHVASSTMPTDRATLVRELLRSERISRREASDAVDRSRPKVATDFAAMESLGLGVRVRDGSGETAPEYLKRSELTERLWCYAMILEETLPPGVPQLHRPCPIATKGPKVAA